MKTTLLAMVLCGFAATASAGEPEWNAAAIKDCDRACLAGVMDGYMSDLRTGLPYQGVEIHEPVRLLMVIEAQPEAMFKIMARNPTVGNILRNGWVQLAVLDPASNKIQLFRDGAFQPYSTETQELPVVASSIDWYRGWRDHLGFAVVEPHQG